MTPTEPVGQLVTPYYADDLVTLYHGDCREVTAWLQADTLITDPPYPNNASHFDDAVGAARTALSLREWAQAIVFWNELERPPLLTSLAAVHIWHRTNVNGRPYEPAYHFTVLGRKMRSDVIRYPAIFDGAGPGCREYVGHPTQKPVIVMRQLVEKTDRTVADPFAGSGSTLIAAKQLGRHAIGVEINERYCEIAARRLAQDCLDFGEAS